MNFAKYIPADDAWLKKAMVLPKNTSADSDVLSFGEGGQNGSIVIVAEVKDAITLTATKVLTIEIKTSSDKTNWKTIHKETFDEAPTGQVLDYVLPPSSLEHTKVTLTTDDSSAAGSLDIYAKYIPR